MERSSPPQPPPLPSLEAGALAAAAAAAEAVFREHAQREAAAATATREQTATGSTTHESERQWLSTSKDSQVPDGVEQESVPAVAPPPPPPPPAPPTPPPPPPVPCPPPRTACPSAQEHRLRTGQLEHVGRCWAVIAFLHRGRVRTCAFKRGHVRVNGCLLSHPLPAVFERGMPLTFCPELVGGGSSDNTETWAWAAGSPCPLVTRAVRVEECVRFPAIFHPAEVTALHPGASGDACVHVCGERVAVTFARRCVSTEPPPRSATTSRAARAPTQPQAQSSPQVLLREGWPVWVRLEAPSAEAAVPRAAAVLVCSSAEARAQMRRRYMALALSQPREGEAAAGEEETAASAEAEAELESAGAGDGAGATPARVGRISGKWVMVVLWPGGTAGTGASIGAGAPREVSVDLNSVWVNGRREPPERVRSTLRPGWPVRVAAAFAHGKLAAARVFVTDEEVVGSGRWAAGVVVELSDVAGVAEFPLWGGRERAVFYRRAVRMRDDEAAGDAPASATAVGSATATAAEAAVGTAATPCAAGPAAAITRRSGKVAALCDLLRKGQRVLLTLTLSCSAPGFSFKALSVEPFLELPPAPPLTPSLESTLTSSPVHAAPTSAPSAASKSAGKKARKKATETMGQAASEHGGFPCPPQKSLHTSLVGSPSGINSGSHSDPHAGSYLDPQTGYQTGSLRGPRKGSETEQQLGLPSSAAKALAVRLGPVRQCCVVRATAEAVLFRVQFSGVTSQAAVLAPNIQLCGVPLDGVDLTLVLAPGQELDVHLLPEDEKHIISTDTCSTSNLTLSWQNHFYVSVLWLGRAHLETSSKQIAELTNFCHHHKVPNTVRHKLTHRLGQILEKDGRKKIIISSDEDNFGETVENQKKSSIKKKNECKITPQLSNPSIERAVVEKLKDLGPENFLRLQLKQLIHSALKESVHAAQEFFLSSLKEHCGSTPIFNKLAAETPDMVESAIQEYFLEKQKKAQAEGCLRFVAVRSAPAQPANGAGDACADGVSVGAQTAARAAAAATAAARAVASNTNTNTSASAKANANATATVVAASVALSQAPSHVTPQVAVAVAAAAASPLSNEAKRALEKDGARVGGDDGECSGGSKVRGAAVDQERCLQHPKEGLQATTQTYSAMQEPVRKQSKIDVVDKLTVESNTSAVAPSESSLDTQESPSLNVADTEKGEPDTRDFQKTLSAELQKHARELALFRDEACSLIENWKSADSPPATPEELEFLQELSLLLENRVEGGGKTEKNEEDTSVVAQQLIKFWNTANFPLTPVAQRGLQRLQELFGVPDKKMEGSEKDCLGSSGDGLVEVEAALKEVRDAFRDVKHVFEVQRCFRDLRECFRDVRRAYRGREPRPRALPPCADAPAAAAAVAALAEAVVQVKKRGRNIPGVTGSRTPSPTQTSPQAQGRKKPQLLCPTCKAGIPTCTSGDDTTSPTNDSTISSTQRNLAEKSKIEVCSTSSQTTTSMETPLSRETLPATSDQSAQTISTGAVLALHLLPDQ